jgi:tetratricopeptide (TPR) repeat protein
LSNYEDLLQTARDAIDEGKKEKGVKILVQVAEKMGKNGEYEDAAKLFEEAAMIYYELYKADESFKLFDKATLMLVRLPQDNEIYAELVRLNSSAAMIAETAEEYKKAADFYFRAKDFAMGSEEQNKLTLQAADALENIADEKETQELYGDTIAILRKVGRLYYTAGDEELGDRINDRAVKLARKWADISKKDGDFLSAGNALAEAAQLMQTKGESPEATRTMMEAGELYEAASLFEKAGNIYDAAQEAYKLQRLTSARTKAISKCAEAYLKAQGPPESVAPLLVKAGAMFKEINRPMKAKWAYLQANELFGELAARSMKLNDTESHMKYLRFQAMCLLNWGQNEVASEMYIKVISHYLKQAKQEEESNNKELQAVAIEEAAEVLMESGRATEAKTHLEDALVLYVQLAEQASKDEDNESSSKFFSKAADCAMKLEQKNTYTEFHKLASEAAERAAQFYQDLGVSELTTVWLRTAGLEALATESKTMIQKSIELLTESAKGFQEKSEYKEAFEDLFTVFETRFLHYADKRRPIKAIIKQMDELASITQDETMASIVALIRALNVGNHISALLILQENEEDMLDKAERIRELVSKSKEVRSV